MKEMSQNFGDCFSRAIGLFDAANARDPNQDAGAPKELLYAQRMSEMLARFAPEASEAVALAVRGQHIQRWTVPRSTYPMTKEGYYQWRTGLYRYHADTAGALMAQAGYDESMVARVKAVIGKVGLRINEETQMMEDVINLVFLEHYLFAFASSKPDYDEDKWLGILRKTWRKMSESAQAFALSGSVSLPPTLVPLIMKAIGQ